VAFKLVKGIERRGYMRIKYRLKSVRPEDIPEERLTRLKRIPIQQRGMARNTGRKSGCQKDQKQISLYQSIPE